MCDAKLPQPRKGYVQGPPGVELLIATSNYCSLGAIGQADTYQDYSQTSFSSQGSGEEDYETTQPETN